MSSLRFEWDPRKAAINGRKHGVSFDEAATVWTDPNACFLEDVAHSDTEDRGKAIGFSEKDRLLAVIFTVRNNGIRIISARKAAAAEEAAYVQNLR